MSPVMHRAAPPVAITRAESFSAFRTAASSSFVPLNITPISRQDAAHTFTARLRSASSEGIAFTEVNANAHVVERSPELIAQGGTEFYKVGLLLRGSGMLTQDNRDVVLQRGDLVVYDTARPYTLVFDEDVSNFVLMIPKDRLDLPTPLMNQLTAISLSSGSSLSNIVSPYLAQLASHLDRVSGSIGAKLARHSVDLVGTLFASVLDLDHEPQDPRQVLLRSIREHIEVHLGSAELGPASIAAAHYISTRHLQDLFHEQDTTVSAWIRSRRLEHCREDLLDPVHRTRPIAAIAARWGFVDAAHFSRIFKAHFGESPSELRAR